MPVEIIGMIGVKPEGADGAAVHVIGGAVDTPWLRAFAQAHENAGFDRVLVGYTSTSAEGFAVTGYYDIGCTTLLASLHGGPDMAPKPPTARGTPAEPRCPSIMAALRDEVPTGPRSVA